MQRSSTRLFAATLLAVVSILATGMAVVTASTEPPVEEAYVAPVETGTQSGGAFTALATNCRTTFSSGSGSSLFEWCFSDDGNIMQIENVEGNEHVRIGSLIEGFCVSAGGTKRAQSNAQSANIGLQAPTYPGGAKVAHRTTDGDIRILQRFVQQRANRQINILMDIENTSDSALTNVRVARFVDADTFNSAGNDEFHQGTFSTQALVPGQGHLDLINQTVEFPTNTMIFDTFDPSGILDDNCYDATADTLTEYTGDGSMALMATLGTIFPGEKKQVKFLYRIAS